MRLPKDILSGTYTRPKLFLCEVDKTKICQLEALEMKASLKFNTYSELEFTVSRTYTSMATGQTEINPFYNKIEALRLLYLDGFGYFEIQDPEIVSDGVREVKNITAYSLEYTLSQKYLEGFNINTGENNSLEVVYSNGSPIVPITLYNEGNSKLSLLNLILEKAYGWSIGHVDNSLKTMSRMFEVSRVSVYDFIMQDLCEKFNCFAVFDTVNNTVNLYAEALISKHIGDGITRSFTVSPAYEIIDTVSINSYKTKSYVYNPVTGVITFDEAPEDGSKIEIVDGSQSKWQTDVYASFENLAKEVNISYSADDIKTVLTVKGQDDLDIREVNMGLPYVVDLSYYHSVDWMGQDLYDAYTEYLKTNNVQQSKYTHNSKRMIEIMDWMIYLSQRLSLQYVEAKDITNTTTGIYYIKGGTYPNHYYKEVNLPDEYNANIECYYTLSDIKINEDKVSDLYKALQVYFVSEDEKDVSEIEKLEEDFSFIKSNGVSVLVNKLKNASSTNEKRSVVVDFLNIMWDELGQIPLETLYLKPYQKIKETNIEAGWNEESNGNYWRYYVVEIMVHTIENAINLRKECIEKYKEDYNELQEENNMIAQQSSIYNVFTDEQLRRLSPFLREDEYTDDNFIVTESDTIDATMKTKQELLECGRIELSKLCEPKLEFTMDMSNIYAMPEFEPIVHQFQLGNLINVVVRSDYIKRARLLAVNINFDDFSDFSCDFGELTNLRTPSSIHADLLANALSAGKSVASNASYWNKGSDAATSLSVLIQQGLLDATTTIKAIDGNQGVEIDQYGIHLRKYNESTGEIDPKEGWIINNQFLYSDDNFKTTKSVFGEYTIGGQSKWGLLAEAVMAGYVAGCTIEGGTINIGEGAFVVDENGNVTMSASNNISGYTTNDEANQLRDSLSSKIELNKSSITAEVNRATAAEEELTSKVQINADSIGAEVVRATNAENELGSKIKINADSITAEVTRAKNVESSLSSKIDINANAITSKVSSGDFGTLIEQNYDHVKIAWNNNSKYISFENGSLNIYTSNAHSDDTLLMKQTYQGSLFYHKGYQVGHIGTNSFDGDQSYRGLVFDLSYTGNYMCWAKKDTEDATNYTTKLVFYGDSKKKKAGLHFNCDTYVNSHLYLTDTQRVLTFSDGSIGYRGEINFVDSSNTVSILIDGTAKKLSVAKNSSLLLHNGAIFTIYNDVATNIYSDIDMHNFNIRNVQITEASDARLKTNIQDSQVDALSVLSQINMKEFDWIETGAHENIGIIAQQLQTIEPNLVYEDEKTGSLSIKTSKFIPYLIKAVQELYKTVSDTEIATYRLNKSTQWVDEYTVADKEKFVASLKEDCNTLSDISKEEIIQEPLLIPIDD